MFAHQDDEYFITPFIIRERKEGNAVSCVYLTDGESYGIDSGVRNQESLKALSALGVSRSDIIFLGSEKGFKDSTTMVRCQEIFDALNSKLDGKTYRRIYCPAWEGGHVDHDAVHLIALALATSRGLISETWQFSLYNARLAPKGLFRVMSPVRTSARTRTARISFLIALKCAFLCRYYRSQWKTWLGLSPEAIFKMIVYRRIKIQVVSIIDVFHRPHESPLLYETRFGIPYVQFMGNTEVFRTKYLRE
jgi:LmbE family N-acetylglucosaminyl deacetylase